MHCTNSVPEGISYLCGVRRMMLLDPRVRCFLYGLCISCVRSSASAPLRLVLVPGPRDRFFLISLIIRRVGTYYEVAIQRQALELQLKGKDVKCPSLKKIFAAKARNLFAYSAHSSRSAVPDMKASCDMLSVQTLSMGNKIMCKHCIPHQKS
jgi:hypothetical protein